MAEAGAEAAAGAGAEAGAEAEAEAEGLRLRRRRLGPGIRRAAVWVPPGEALPSVRLTIVRRG